MAQPEEHTAQLRGAVHRTDAAAVVAVLRGESRPPDSLQLIGDGLIGDRGLPGFRRRHPRIVPRV